MKTITFKISDDLFSDIKSLARELGENRSSVIRRAVRFYIDRYDEAITKIRLEDPERIMIPHETVLKEFGL